REPHLPCRGSGLLLLEPQPAAREAEQAPSSGDGARGDDHHLLPGLAAGGGVGGERVRPIAGDAPRIVVNRQRPADLDDKALGLGDAISGAIGHAADSRRRSASRAFLITARSAASTSSRPSPLTPERRCTGLRAVRRRLACFSRIASA